MTTPTFSTFVGYVGDLVTASVSWIGSVVGAIVASPLLTLFVMFGFVGIGIGLVRRIISVR